MAGELQERREILVPVTGELVNVDDPAAVGVALETLRALEAQIADVKRELTAAVVELSKRYASKTIREDGVELVVNGGSETVYDAEAIEQALRRKKIPESVISEIVVQTVTHKVDARRAKAAAGANADVKKIIERHRKIVEKRPSISVKLPPGRARIPAPQAEGSSP